MTESNILGTLFPWFSPTRPTELKRETSGKGFDFLDDVLKCFIISTLPKATTLRHGLMSLFGVCTTPHSVQTTFGDNIKLHISIWNGIQWILFWNVVLGRDYWLLHSHEQPPPVRSHQIVTFWVPCPCLLKFFSTYWFNFKQRRDVIRGSEFFLGLTWKWKE